MEVNTLSSSAVTLVLLTVLIAHSEVSGETCVRADCANDICRENGLVCCGKCEKLDFALLQVCQCCPQDYICCLWTNPNSPVCCPRGWTCTDSDGCIQDSILSPIQATRQVTAFQQCGPMKLAITVDNIALKVYMDGMLIPQLPNYNNRSKVDIVDIPADTRVIAVQGRDVGVIAGMLASIGENYFLTTNTSWKCTATHYADWMKPTYNDASWPAAVFVQPNSRSNRWHNYLPEISANADWIWARNFRHRIDPIVYCRGRLPTDICNKDYGNCRNPCAANNHECCHCEMSHVGPAKVCFCCPQDYTCCPFPLDGPIASGCCPRGFTCYRDGFCRKSISHKPTRIEYGECLFTGGGRREPRNIDSEK